MTAAFSEPGPGAAVRRLPVRDPEPPYDDELDSAGAARTPASAAQGALALAFPLASGLPAVPVVPPVLRLLPGGAGPDDETWSEPQPTPSAALPDPRAWSGRLVQATLEVLAGARPAAQLLRWTSAAVYADIERAVVRGRGHPQRRPRPSAA